MVASLETLSAPIVEPTPYDKFLKKFTIERGLTPHEKLLRFGIAKLWDLKMQLKKNPEDEYLDENVTRINSFVEDAKKTGIYWKLIMVALKEGSVLVSEKDKPQRVIAGRALLNLSTEATVSCSSFAPLLTMSETNGGEILKAA